MVQTEPRERERPNAKLCGQLEEVDVTMVYLTTLYIASR